MRTIAASWLVAVERRGGNTMNNIPQSIHDDLEGEPVPQFVRNARTSRERAITLPPAERDGATRLVRVAVECPRDGTNRLARVSVHLKRAQGHDPQSQPLYPAPYQPGDVLFHQEPFTVHFDEHDIEYDDGEILRFLDQDDWFAIAWHRFGIPAPYLTADTMPSWASRYRLTVVSVELVRLWDAFPASWPTVSDAADWDANNPDHPWASNPWVWVYEVSR